MELFYIILLVLSGFIVFGREFLLLWVGEGYEEAYWVAIIVMLHGVANAIILPTVMEYNAPATGEKYRDIAKAMGVKGTDDMTQEEYRKAAVDAVRKLSQDVGIPANLKDIVKEEDIPFLAQSAYDDACRPGNPRETSVEEIKELYLSLM